MPTGRYHSTRQNFSWLAFAIEGLMQCFQPFMHRTQVDPAGVALCQCGQARGDLWGSGCQLALLDDAEMLERARQAGVALLLVHVVNPRSFSDVNPLLAGTTP